MGKLTVTCFITLDNVVEDPQLWSGKFQSDDTGALNDAVLQRRGRDAARPRHLRGLRRGMAVALGRPLRRTSSTRCPSTSCRARSRRPSWNNSAIVDDDVIERVRALRDEQNLLVWGSPTLVQSLMDHDLVDEYVLLVSPIVRGRGIRLFRDGADQHDLRVAEATLLSGGMLALRMTPARA